MDPLRASKVNELAKSLVEHGIASSMDEALKQAEHLVRGESNEEIRNVKTPEEINSTDNKEVDEEMKVDEHNTKIDEKIKQIDINSKSIVELQNKTNEIIGEVNKIEETLVGILKRLDSGGMSTASTASQQNIGNKPDSNRGSKADSKTEAKLRTGGLKPGDVKIEDYFYSGSKKKEN